MQIMRTLGHNMAWMLKVMREAKDVPHAPAEPRQWTNFIR